MLIPDWIHLTRRQLWYHSCTSHYLIPGLEIPVHGAIMKHIHGLSANYVLPMHRLLQERGSGNNLPMQKPSGCWQKKQWKSTKLAFTVLKLPKTLNLFLSREDIPKQLKRQLWNFQTLSLHGTTSWNKSEWSNSNLENALINWTLLWKKPNKHYSFWLLPPDIYASFACAYSCICHIPLQNWVLKESINLKCWL